MGRSAASQRRHCWRTWPASYTFCRKTLLDVALYLQVLVWCGGAIVLSVLSYPLLQLARTQGWCKFVGASPHEFKAQLRGQLTSARTSFNSLASLGSEDEARDDEQANRPMHDRSEFLGEDISGSMHDLEDPQ